MNSRSLSTRARDMRRSRHRAGGTGTATTTTTSQASGQENVVNGTARHRPPSPSFLAKGNSNSSPPCSPRDDLHQTSATLPSSSSPNRRPRTPVNRPPLVTQQQQAGGGTGGSGWEDPPQQQHQQPDTYNGTAPRGSNTQHHFGGGGGGGGGTDARSVASERMATPSSPLGRFYRYHHHHHHHHQSSPRETASSAVRSPVPSSNRSVVSDTFLLHNVESGDSGEDNNEDIPMDERSADIRSQGGGQNPHSSQHQNHQRASSPHLRPMPSVLMMPKPQSNNNSPPSQGSNNNNTNAPNQTCLVDRDDDVSSLGGVEDSNNLSAMTAALRSKQKVLRGLSPEEATLWDTVQGLLKQQQQQPTKQITTENNQAPVAAASEEIAALKAKMAEQEREQANDMRAIQRVLADVTQQRDQALAQLSKATLKKEDEKKEDNDEAASLKEKAKEDEKKIEQLQSDLSLKKKEIAHLQERFENLKTAKAASDSEVSDQKKQIAKLQRHPLYNQGDDSRKNSEEKDHDKRDSASNKTREDKEDIANLKKQLDEKSAALENAKMIIASLENASGCLASDTRVKIKAKDAEISALKMELQQCKKKLDTLATELRNSQRATAASDDYKNHLFQQSAHLTAVLNRTLANLRTAWAILETTQSPSSIQNLPELFADCSEALKKSLNVFDGPEGSEGKQQHYAMPPKPSEAELQAFQEELKKVKEQALHYRLEAERVEKQRENDVKTLYAEIQMLRMECSINMEVLTKKERELAVLRDSLKVEDEEVGYISDDASEADDDDGPSPPPPPPPPYGPSQAEALATLLAHGKPQQGTTTTARHGLGRGDESALKNELAQARMDKERAMKELKTERESLANAKMIISSLEKANKSMMEDLRSRLHDSNTAIASLLEKSMESEKTTAKLQSELEALRMEKAKNEEKLLQQPSCGRSLMTMTITETID